MPLVSTRARLIDHVTGKRRLDADLREALGTNSVACMAQSKNHSHTKKRRPAFQRLRTLVLNLSGILLLVTSTMSQSNTPAIPTEWQTHAEKTEYRETPSYDETIEYSKRLDAASPLIRFQSFGKSGEGRDLPLLIAAEGETFTPE